MKINNKIASVVLAITAILLILTPCSAVNSETTLHSKASVLLKGETENTIISSEGTISLAAESSDLDLKDLLEDAWIVNAITKDSKGNTYIATSPNGVIVKYFNGKAEKIYPVQSAKKTSGDDKKASEKKNSNDPNQSDSKENKVNPFINMHVFAMAMDNQGRLLAGVSGDNCELIRFDEGKVETLFTSDDVSYILEIITDKSGNIYLGTGPNGKVYRLTPDGKYPKMVYDSADNNILSLVLDSNNFIYAGSDKRGIIYKIHPFNRSATIVYDSAQDEVTDLIIDENGNIYAAATSAKSVRSQTHLASISAGDKPGRPDARRSPESKGSSTAKLNVDNTEKSQSNASARPPEQPSRGDMPQSASHIYKIDSRGFVSNVFNDNAVFFNMLMRDGKIFLGTGNKAQLVAIDTKTEQKTIVYEDQVASQITALAFNGNDILIGTSNPAKVITLSDTYHNQGTYISPLVDAGQPARWGKLQVEAELPQDCEILLAARSGNIKEPNDPTFSQWTKNRPVKEPTKLNCPIGRYCQYRLTLLTKDNKKTPKISRIAIPHVIDNRAPVITEVRTERSKDPKQPETIKIGFLAADANKDRLTFKIEFRKTGNTRWILLKDKLNSPMYEWKTNTVEDGRYEVRITADDAGSNTTKTALTGSRISDPIVVDNTPPQVKLHTLDIKDSTATVKLTLIDDLSVISNLSYTVNSNEDWISTLPDDLIYDTRQESFTINVKDLEPGENIIAVRFMDEVKNANYKTFEAKID